MVAGTPAPPSADSFGPGVSGLRLRPKPLRKGKAVRVSWNQFEKAPARLRIARAGKGRKRARAVKRFGRAHAGVNRVRLRRLAGKRLRRGRYVATLIAVDFAGNRSSTKSRFRVR